MADKTIGVLTSGGDAPGMNAAIRAVVRAGIGSGMRVLGIRHGYNGILNSDVVEMSLRSVSDIIYHGGTTLYTARCDEFQTESGLEKAAINCKNLGLDGLIIIGGDGSFRGAMELSKRGIQCVGIPGTIDNDIGCSEYTIGFDTAMNTAMEMVDKLRDTAQSHDRCSVVEVMGRRSGEIALKTGVAVGATAIIVPERAYDFEKDILNRIKFTQKIGKKHFIIVVAEGVGKIEEIAKEIEEKCNIGARPTVLGHVQRGGSPTLRDRLVASVMGYQSVQILNTWQESKVVAMQNGKIVGFDMEIALNMKKPFDGELYEAALAISI